MLEANTILEVLEKNIALPNAEFAGRAGALAAQFKAILVEKDAAAAASYLEVAVNDLFEICLEYEPIAALFSQADHASAEAALVSAGLQRPSVPNLPDIVKIKETANRYYALITQLKELTTQAKK